MGWDRIVKWLAGAMGALAGLLGETPGRRIGWRMRGDTLTGPECRIEIVTEGVLTRMIQSSPDLENVACHIRRRSDRTRDHVPLWMDCRLFLIDPSHIHKFLHE